jgi:flavin-dependent dehydrogenase
MFDVLVAGAGPAGAVAATILARAGARVALLDRARFPRDKLCGDSLNPGALAILARLGLSGVTAAGLPVDGMILTSDPSVHVIGRYKSAQGCMIRRRDLDAALLRAAADAGARVEEGVLVEGPLLDSAETTPRVIGLVIKGRDGRSLRVPAPLVIAADGRYSRVARALGLSYAPQAPRRWAMGAYFEGVADLTAFGEMHIRPEYYVGIAPLPGGLANACVVTADRGALATGSTLLSDTLAHDGRLAPRFRSATMVTSPVCLGPLAVDCRAAGARGLLLAGDAAGFVDPMTGDGLRFALRGAELAAAEALRTLEHGTDDGHVRLEAARRRAFAGKWRFNRGLRAVVASPGALRAAGTAAWLAPAIPRRLLQYAGDLGAP